MKKLKVVKGAEQELRRVRRRLSKMTPEEIKALPALERETHLEILQDAVIEYWERTHPGWLESLRGKSKDEVAEEPGRMSGLYGRLQHQLNGTEK